jgi:hypothetical protein
MPASHSTIFCLKEPVEKAPVGLSLNNESPETTDDSPDGEFLLCANCLNMITARRAAMTVNGSHEHTFANPSGLVYTIGCFRWAPGCFAFGDTSAEFAWFSGYLWRVVICAACQCHLGWLFSSGESSFFGLILKNMIEGRAAGDNG